MQKREESGVRRVGEGRGERKGGWCGERGRGMGKRRWERGFQESVSRVEEEWEGWGASARC